MACVRRPVQRICGSIGHAGRRRGAVVLLDGTRLPCETIGGRAPSTLVWGHGLGPVEPWNMGRRTCESFPVIQEAVAPKVPAGSGPIPFNVVIYDARGHGASTGWEPAASCIQQFHWRSLAFDMLSVALQHRVADCRGAFLGGYSMGASSAVWAAYLYPTAVRGLVLLSVTTAWEIRASRRGRLLDNASKLEESNAPAAAVVRGAAFADLPDLDALRAAALPMPVFLAAARDDTTHPAEIVERLASVLPDAQVLIKETTAELRQEFPGALRAWFRSRFG